jgi:hypothetical protein
MGDFSLWARTISLPDEPNPICKPACFVVRIARIGTGIALNEKRAKAMTRREGTGMRRETSDTAYWLGLIRSEYLEMPGLHLTKSQFCRLWGLEPGTCDELLQALVSAEFLRLNSRGLYVLANLGH